MRLGFSAAISIGIVVTAYVLGNSGNLVAFIWILAPGIMLAKPFATTILRLSQPTRQLIVAAISAGFYTLVLFLVSAAILAPRKEK